MFNPYETRECWLEVDLEKIQTIGRVTIAEMQARIKKFRLEYRTDPNGEWKTALEGAAAGTKYDKAFAPVQTRYVRLHILDASFAPTIWEFQVYPPAK
ncbi:MAG: discoidin domain-containing protein [Candidatus Sumerlaeota bacterium]|nr:discoidin domain-containing protein [Candidatus Sumerlaeota bacterium]